MSKVLIVDCGSMGISYDLILKQEGTTTTKIGIKKQAYEAIKELEQQLKEAEKDNQTLRLHNTRTKLVLENKMGDLSKQLKEMEALITKLASGCEENSMPNVAKVFRQELKRIKLKE